LQLFGHVQAKETNKGDSVLKFLSGFESTHIFGSGKDVLELTKHTELVESDLRLARQCGLNLLRYSVPWHRIEQVKGVYDWQWMDRAMRCLQELGIAPILDPLHHTSFPEWLKGGFASLEFGKTYLQFVTLLAERYPWARHYTVINEPFVTTWFCGHEGTWYPYQRGAASFVPMIMNVAETISAVSRMLVRTVDNLCLVHVDAAEKHRSADEVSQAHADFHNEIRFIVPDLVLGKVNEGHALFDYLCRHGAGKERLALLQSEPARIDIMGLDYYSHCELEWCSRGRIYPNQSPEGLVPTAMEYADRYNLPLMLTETNVRGFVQDRISWLKFMVEQCEEIDRRLKPRGLTFEGFCWYPLIDSTDWDSLVKEANGNIDPQGIFYLDKMNRRRASELSDVYRSLALGEITSKEIPAYRFQAPLDHHLAAFMPMMEHWDWQEPHLVHTKAAVRRRAIAMETTRQNSNAVANAKRLQQNQKALATAQGI
jgi:beta-glucosidase/6-phospho-beta-glucosidase/beta-galactosidase